MNTKKINIELDMDTYGKVKSQAILEDRSVKNMLQVIVKKYVLQKDKELEILYGVREVSDNG